MRITLHDTPFGKIAEIAGDGILLASEADARDLIVAVHGKHADWVALHVENIDPRFFDLKTGLAGEVLQKFVNWKCKLAVIGDVAHYTEKSESFAALVRESNRGRDARFVVSLDELA